ncbi:MAG: hypothetical protein PT947_03975 [Suipraeoptans intestinalis]|nr:hypothetical protein [Suipraeoptans intestinalis]
MECSENKKREVVGIDRKKEKRYIEVINETGYIKEEQISKEKIQ